MEAIRKLDQMFDVLKNNPKKRLVAAYANDSHTIEAVNEAISLGIVEGTLVGDKSVIKSVCEQENIDIGRFKIVHEPNGQAAAAKAVELINLGEGDVLMKGLVSTGSIHAGYFEQRKWFDGP